MENAKFNTHKLSPKNPKTDAYAIYFHGGGYYSGSVISHKNLLSQITASINMVTYIFEYRLSPEAVFPNAHDDAKEIVTFLDNIEEGKNSIWIGESAGGGLATGLCVDDKFPLRPKKLVLMSPWLDLSDKNKDRNFLKNKDILILLDGMHMMGEYYSGDHDPSNPILSPVFADIKSFPDVLIQVCSNELLYNDAVEFSKKLELINSKHELQVWDDLWHAWQFFPIKEAEEAREKITKFINTESYSSSK
jgi:acetyl esterase/lipase